jgi:hypothetical protein
MLCYQNKDIKGHIFHIYEISRIDKSIEKMHSGRCQGQDESGMGNLLN